MISILKHKSENRGVHVGNVYGDSSDIDYRIRDLSDVMTPALAIYPEIVQANIESTLRILDGSVNRWRPHVKTPKVTKVIRMLIQRGIKQFKCATTLELRTTCEAGATDVLVANSMAGANAARVCQIADQASTVQISSLVESPDQVEQWRNSRVGLFVDINSGMNRTGIEQTHDQEILDLVCTIRQAGVLFRGLHYYDGHLRNPDISQRCAEAHRGYDSLLEVARRLQQSEVTIEEIVTSGTPTFLCAASYSGFRNGSFMHRVSPGTVTYCDLTSAAQIPPDYGFRPAAIVVTRVVSHPHPGIITCDSGHKTLSVDMGTPNCLVLGHANFRGSRPSEEHLPIEFSTNESAPSIGDFLYLVPRHICPTVNNFDHALFVRNGEIESIEPVSARGRELPILSSSLT
jgi:D-serine deaminase-like pyridoxal phosphate-dependent protein